MFSRYQTFLITTLLVYLALLAWLSLTPASYFSSSLVSFPGADKIVHVIIYLFLGFLLFLFINDITQKTRFKTYLIVFTLASAYGVLMELLQLWIRSSLRSFEFADIAANCAGVAMGILAGYFISSVTLERNADPPVVGQVTPKKNGAGTD
ncbi:MAG: VanZ family protein [Methanolobus sp.]|nr:VanZ family protein [Methanolobus sp.]